jgi:membrane metallo-endopeptidase-like protein 1
MVGVQKPVFTLGNLANWWEEETKNRFLEKANCIIWQYGNYSADSINKTLNGINTQVTVIS